MGVDGTEAGRSCLLGDGTGESFEAFEENRSKEVISTGLPDKPLPTIRGRSADAPGPRIRSKPPCATTLNDVGGPACRRQSGDWLWS